MNNYIYSYRNALIEHLAAEVEKRTHHLIHKANTLELVHEDQMYLRACENIKEVIMHLAENIDVSEDLFLHKI